MRLADVALPVPVGHPFSYAVPDKLAARVVPGARVLCALGGRRVLGVVLDVREADPPAGVKSLAAAVDELPALPDDLLAFLRDLSSYYLAPIGEALRLALPPVEKSAARVIAEPLPGEAMPLFGHAGGGVGGRRVQWVTPTSKVDPDPHAKPLGGQAAAILAHLRAAGAVPLAKLEQTWGNARAAVRRLDALGLALVESRDAPDDAPFEEVAPRDAPPKLTAEQEQATRAIEQTLRARRAATFLLHGVTGSGKTEVYLRAIAVAREVRRGALMLVPEIALTPQLVARFRARFGDDVAVLHSGLTPRERLAMWKRLRSGDVDVAIGARSALFAPVRDLGLIVVDEEHDPSFKQEEGVRYHARDMAILRARRAGGVCVLGSATPSLETEHLARIGKAEKIVLASRARAQPMPRVEIVDLRRIGAGPTGDKRLSLPLHRALEETLRAREQAILFLNRRGFAPSVRCEACGEMCSCDDCSVALTFHKREGTLRCHYCDVELALPAACPKCQSPRLVLEGLGTERLEETLAAAFPEARIARLDRDVASGRSIEKVLARVRAREVDILVGTQMVTKGHDMPHVTLVGVINADAALSIPDFRAAERAFQLLVQVAGRAGRGDVPGRVLVQTYGPDHAAIAFGAKHDVSGFVERELSDRRELGYPPYSRVALVRVDAPTEEAARQACAVLADAARAACAAADLGDVELLGPAPAPVARVRGRYRFRLMLRSADRAHLRSVLLKTDAARGQLPRGVRSTVDVDPVQLL
jgi:primosomal protein N' (replication factor Y) (superfamily II helicase)